MGEQVQTRQKPRHAAFSLPMPAIRNRNPSARDRCSPCERAFRRALLLPLLLLALTTAGCGGCNSTDVPQGETDVEKRNQQLAEKEKKERLEIQPLLPLIGQEYVPDDAELDLPEEKAPPFLIKPGHWTLTVQEMKANYSDFVGRSTTTLLNQNADPAVLSDTNFTFRLTRPVALAKGRTKLVEGELFVPDQGEGIRLRSVLTDRTTGIQYPLGDPLLQKMPSYQYFLLVLSKEASKYGFLKVTDAVRMPWEEEFDASSQPHYRVVLADAGKSLPLPSSLLNWTSVAYLVWDEVDPTRLTADQQLALVDWLQWGGRLIVNGPDSLDTLRGTFLEQYLPADKGDPRKFTKEDLADWSAYWGRRAGRSNIPAISPTNPWSGVSLEPRDGTKELAGGSQLFYEGQVGNGTIVVSAVQLTERDLINWPGYDSFLNAGLLRRPSRVFSEGPYGGARTDWIDFKSWRLDAHLATGLRMFARDAGVATNTWRSEQSQPDQFGANQFGQFGMIPADPTIVSHVDRRGGLGSWTHSSPAAEAARNVLTEAAAVQVPGAGFVLSCLSLYLLVLVPLNWIVFRALDRVELAWVAAPVIAILGTLAIVRQAQLDIGFVRSQTEIALLELQPEHPRGLLSRFTALYSSLSTTYDMNYSNQTTVATPFPGSSAPNRNESIWDVSFEKQDETQLTGLAVSSSSTKMSHSEEVFPLEGTLRVGKSSRGHEQLENHLGYDLRDVIVVRRSFDETGRARLESSWLGELRNGSSSAIGLQPLGASDESFPHQQQRQAARVGRSSSPIDVEPLLAVALQFPGNEDPALKRRDEYRVVGLIDQVLPGSEVNPAASQVAGTTVVLAHLEYGDLPTPRPDENNSSDVIKVKPSP